MRKIKEFLSRIRNDVMSDNYDVDSMVYVVSGVCFIFGAVVLYFTR